VAESAPPVEPSEPSPPASRDGETAAAPPAADVPAPSNEPEPAEPPPVVEVVRPSLFERNQIIAYYGTPLAPGLGVLGLYSPEEGALRLRDHAAIYDSLNGDRGTVAALDLIYAMAQAEPTKNGLYLSYMKDDVVNHYIALADQHDLQLILDLHIGRGNVAEEVRKVERFLLHPRVHVAIDPEYAVGPEGLPIQTPGRISGHDINQAQEYLGALVTQHNLPPKMFLIHQFMDHTIVEGEATVSVPNVDLVLNMDAFGAHGDKVKKYRHFASRPYAERLSFNVFLKQDEPVSTEQDVLQLDPAPDMVIYQ
jgi:hypothetical protein